MRLGLGRTGVAIVVLLFLLLGVEDVYVWVDSGVVPGVEFFAALLVVLVVFVVAIREARAHPPSR